MTTPLQGADLQRLGAEHYADRRRVVQALVGAVQAWWSYLSRSNISGSYADVVEPGLLRTVEAAQRAVATPAAGYVREAMGGDLLAEPDPEAHVGTTQDGRPLSSLLDLGRQRTLGLVAAGMSVNDALSSGLAVVQRAAISETQDAGRAADAVAMATHPAVGGYVRHLALPSCSDCVVLAGRFYKWSDGFDRHPACDCTHVPAADADAAGPRVDPEAALASGQVYGLTKAEVRALEEGADLGRIVNAHRGKMRTAKDGSRRRGGKLTPETIYQRAGGDRDKALQLLRENGYLTDSPRPRDLSALRDRTPLQREPERTAEPEPEDTEVTRARLQTQIKALEARGREVYRDYNAARNDARTAALRQARAELGDGPNGRAAFSHRVNELVENDPEVQRLSAEVRAVSADLTRSRAELNALPPPPIQDAAVRALPRKTREMDVREDSAETNPGYGSTPRYGINCVHVVNAYELRRRGYDVTATPLPLALGNSGRNSQEALSRWRDPEGKVRHLETVTKRQLIKTVDEWPPGARGWVTIRWGRDYGGGGHIFAVERTTNGVTWVEAQKGVTLDRVETYLARSKTGKDVLRVVRVDDLTPEDGVLEFVNERGEA